MVKEPVARPSLRTQQLNTYTKHGAKKRCERVLYGASLRLIQKVVDNSLRTATGLAIYVTKRRKALESVRQRARQVLIKPGDRPAFLYHASTRILGTLEEL